MRTIAACVVHRLRIVLTRCAFLSILLSCGPIRSEPQWEHVPIESTLGDVPVHLDPSLRPGVLRIVISGVRKLDWEVRLDYGTAGQVVLDAASSEARTVRLQGNNLVLDVPLVAGAPLTARSNQKGLSVRVLEAITLVGTFSEQMIESSTVRLIDSDSSPNDRRLADALAKVELLGAGGEILGLCTAFRISKGYWLTAAHCAYRDETKAGGSIVEKLRMQTGAFAGTMVGTPPFTGTPVASGIRTLPVTAKSIVRSRDLDYVLLAAPDDAGGATIVMDRAPAVVGDKLALFQYWGGIISPAPGFAKSDGKSCEVQSRDGPDNDFSRPDLCPAAMQHGCSSQDGTSGAPLVNVAGQLVAVHYGAGKTSRYNCAIPIATVLSHLCQSNPSVARKVTSCP